MVQTAPSLGAMLNLTHYHREHELFYSRAPLEDGVRLQAVSRALKALALRWSEPAPPPPGDSRPPAPRYTGCEDLNDPRATEALGILFMEGEGEPAELGKARRGLRSMADEAEQGGTWLAEAMAGNWSAAAALVRVPPLAGVLGDRHRIIANNWLMADQMLLVDRLLRRAADLLDAVELTPKAIRADLAGPRWTPAYVLSAAELVDAAADLSATAGLLVHDSEPRWRRFRERVAQVAAAPEAPR